jgi:hypothetical protein
MNYSTDPRWLASLWISASPGTYYVIELLMEFNTKNLTFLSAGNLLTTECNLPKDHFTLTLSYSVNSVIALVNPFRQQSMRLQLSSTNIIVSSNISISSCTMTVTSPQTTDQLTIQYSSSDQSLQLGFKGQTFKCSFTQITFVYNVLYYTVTPLVSTTITAKKSDYEHVGLSVAIEGTSTGCNIGSSGSDCLLIYGQNYLATEQPMAIHPSQSNTSYKLAFVFRNTFSQFRLLLSDLRQYEDSPVPYDTFVDMINISSLLNPEEYKISIDNSPTYYTVSGIS